MGKTDNQPSLRSYSLEPRRRGGPATAQKPAGCGRRRAASARRRMAISMFLDSIYLNWVQRRFQNATPEARSLLRAARVSLPSEAADAPSAGGPLNAYLARNPVLQLLQNNHSWLALLSNSSAIGAGADNFAVRHTSFLAVFFWTNVMAFDVWQAIVTLRPLANPRLREDHYWQYAVYAWTATAAVSAPAFVLHFTELVPEAYRPRFGEVRCWLSGQLAYALYFNLPVGIILLCNVVIFGLTAWALYRAKTLQRVTLQAKQHKKMFYLYVKLSVVMGIIWVFEFIPWITGYYRLYGLAGMLNSLHGIYLFFIFVFKRKTLAQLRQRLSCCGKRTVKPTLSKKYSS
ncbi:hypothetical protein MTO96_047550 [Rhipicephalus appendiculatus]